MTTAALREYNLGMNDIIISRAEERDVPRILDLLLQVNRVHASARPDLFLDGGRKYTADALRGILRDSARPVFAARKDGVLVGYAFCIRQTHAGSNEPPHTTLYLDDLCVDEGARRTGIGKQLFEYVCAYAKAEGDHNVTLNVWNGNDAALRFYESLGMRVQKYCMETIL